MPKGKSIRHQVSAGLLAALAVAVIGGTTWLIVRNPISADVFSTALNTTTPTNIPLDESTNGGPVSPVDTTATPTTSGSSDLPTAPGGADGIGPTNAGTTTQNGNGTTSTTYTDGSGNQGVNVADSNGNLLSNTIVKPDGSATTSYTDGSKDTVSAPTNGQQMVTHTDASGKTTTSTVVAGNYAPTGSGTFVKINSVKPVAATDVGTFFNGLGKGVGGDIGKYIQNIYAWALVIGAGLAVIMVMYSGYLYITSAGDPEGIRSAKDYLVGALIGLATLILTATISKSLIIPTTSLSGNTASSSTPTGPAATGQTTFTVKNADNTTTTTTHHVDGSATVTITNPDGSVKSTSTIPKS